MVVNTGTIRQGDLGTIIQIFVQTTNINGVNVIQDLTSASNTTITIIDPDGNSLGPFSASIIAPATQGLIQYQTNQTTSIWTKGGMWKWYGTYTIPGGTYSTNDAVRYVLGKQ